MKMFKLLAAAFLILAISPYAEARALKMVFWYPGEAGSTAEAQPIIDEFAKLLGAKLGQDTISAKYFNTVDAGFAFIKNERPLIGIVSYAAWKQSAGKLAGSKVILSTLPAPHGKSTEQYSLVGLADKIGAGAGILSSEPLSIAFARTELFSQIPEGAKLAQSSQLLMKLKDIGDGKLNAFAILTPNEALSLERISAQWAKNLKTIARSKPVPTARVVLFDSGFNADKLKSALVSLGTDPTAKDVLNEMRLMGFAENY